MKIGKLDNDLLKRIVLDKIGYRRPEVITRPGIGEDCAVIDFGPYDCVLSTDPITAAIGEIGSLAVHISCNDVASNGVQPLGILLTVLLPPETTEAQIETLMQQAAEAATALGVEIIGGHTEITDSVKQPIISSTAVGRSWSGRAPYNAANSGKSGRAPYNAANPGKSGRAVHDVHSGVSGEVYPGDRILVTKQLALEGTGILATDHGAELTGGTENTEAAGSTGGPGGSGGSGSPGGSGCPGGSGSSTQANALLTEEELAEARAMLDRISVVKEGVLAGEIGVSAMHDITEGGVLGAVWEVCRLAGVGAVIIRDNMPIAGVTEKICAHFELDPLRLISSGSMLIIAPPEEATQITNALWKEGIEATDIGVVKEAGEGLCLLTPAPVPIDPPGADEIYKVAH
jgi:hydrogenase expression/formation protein HypE